MNENLDKARTYAAYSEEHDTMTIAAESMCRAGAAGMYAAIAQAAAAERTAQAMEKIAALLAQVVAPGQYGGYREYDGYIRTQST